ncbi:MAG TPA: hypothetical protein VFZ83_06165 [Acidimicrobiia bacterium]|nr:hypothetical protein [Acidimicrobiia bacterium]
MHPVLRPRGVGEILDAALAVYRARFRAVVQLTAIVVLPVQVLSVLVVLSTQPDDTTPSFTGGVSPVYDSTAPSDVWLQLAGVLVVALAGLLANSFATAAVSDVVAATYLGDPQPDDVRRSWRHALQRFPAVLGVGFLSGIATFVGILLCIAPGVWLYVSWSLAIPALLLERLGVGAALSRSFALVAKRWWTCFAVVGVGALLTSVLQFAFAIPVTFVVDRLGGGVVGDLVLGTVVDTAVAAATTPFLAAMIVVLYFDLRVRFEGLDVQLLIERVGAGDPARLPSPGP